MRGSPAEFLLWRTDVRPNTLNIHLLAWVLLLLLITACSPLALEEVGSRPTPSAVEARVLNTATLATGIDSSRPTLPPSQTPSPSATRTGTSTPTATQTPTATITPTYAILRGRVLTLSNCRYGPGAPYLYKYALIEGSNLEVFGRNDLGTWILVRAIGGTNPCWVKASLLELSGGVMGLAPMYIPLPQSPYYRPPKGVSAVRQGDEVTVSWIGIRLREGDETAEAPYLIEAWLCQDGQLVFTPVGVYAHAFTLVDERGCSEPSHGRLFIVEKHGYTRPTEIPWPAHQ